MVLTKQEIKIALACCGAVILIFAITVPIILGITARADNETIGQSSDIPTTAAQDVTDPTQAESESETQAPVIDEEVAKQPAKVADSTQKKEDSGNKKKQGAVTTVTEPKKENEDNSTVTIGSSTYNQGWNTRNDAVYYVENDMFVTGIRTLSGLKYRFENDGKLASYTCIDVSEWNDDIDWVQVKKNGIDFAFIRSNWRGYSQGGLFVDTMFETNIKNATAAGIKCGAYVFSQAVNATEAAQEANAVLEAVKGYKVELPLVIDMEWSGDKPNGRADKISTAQRTQVAQVFIKTISEAGYYPMIYASRDFLLNDLNLSTLAGLNYDVWVAEYNDTTKYTGYSVWQYTQYGKLGGISEYVDLNICLVNYPQVIKRKGLNNL